MNKDIAFYQGDLKIIGNDIGFIEKSESLKEQLYVFLHIRAGHFDGDGNLIKKGELEFDQKQGIDFTYVFDIATTEGQIKNHYRKQILKYYGEYIKSINKITVEKDVKSRKITLEFEYTTIWSKERQKFKIESEV